MPNRLASEKSPYLLQHANNPVDWFPWCDEAFRVARERDVPVFLSVGYATCHWCHVMERESFEDVQVAKVLNENFVCVKVDREERPDIDRVYMAVCQALTGGGGWPMSIFMTPHGKPFLAGTYFPRNGRMGKPGFLDIAAHVGQLWKKDSKGLFAAGDEVERAIQPRIAPAQGQPPGADVLDSGYGRLIRAFDSQYGGFGDAPKFPTPHHFTFLLRYERRNHDARSLAIIEKTLDAMRSGGIYDHIGFGFHRYSVDDKWLVPHFEKMITDQAMIAIAYIEAFQATGRRRYADTAREIFEYVLRDMTSPEGAFYTAEDADSEGEEGKYYVWTPQEVRETLGEDRSVLFCRVFDITAEGNFVKGTQNGGGASIPRLSKPLEDYAADFGMSAGELARVLGECRGLLLKKRECRVRPLRDDKVIASCNGLMMAAFAKAYMALRDPAYLDAARRSAEFVLSKMRDGSGRLYRRFRQEQVAVPAYSDDYAMLVWGLLETYEASLEVSYLEEAVKLTEQMIALFWDEKNSGFFLSGHDAEKLILRDREIYDGAVPSANSVATLNILRIARLSGNPSWEKWADRLLRAFGPMAAEHPSAYTHFLCAVDFALGPTREIVIAGNAGSDDTLQMIETLQTAFMPEAVWAFRPEDDSESSGRLAAAAPFTGDLKAVDGKAAAYVCENFTCRKPVIGVEGLKKSLAF